MVARLSLPFRIVLVASCTPATTRMILLAVSHCAVTKLYDMPSSAEYRAHYGYVTLDSMGRCEMTGWVAAHHSRARSVTRRRRPKRCRVSRRLAFAQCCLVLGVRLMICSCAVSALTPTTICHIGSVEEGRRLFGHWVAMGGLPVGGLAGFPPLLPPSFLPSLPPSPILLTLLIYSKTPRLVDWSR